MPIVAAKIILVEGGTMRKTIAKILIGSTFCALLQASVCSLVYADDTTELTETNSLPAVPDRHRDMEKGFHGTVGAGIFASESTVGHRHAYVFPVPIVSFRYSDWAYWHITRGGVWVLQSPGRSLRLGLGLRARFGWNENDKDSLLRGMADRRASIDGSINAMWRNPIVTVAVSYYHDLLGVSDGDGAEIRLSHVFALGPKLMLTPFVTGEWRSNRLVNYYYGVRPEEAASNRPAYRGRDTLNVRAGLWGSYLLTQSWSIMAGGGVTRFGDGIADSPIVLDRYRGYGFAGVGWRF